MFRGRGNPCVDQAAGDQLGTRLSGGAFEGEVGELGEGRVGGDGAMVEIGRGALDDGED